MISDELLRTAAEEVSADMLEALPIEQKHDFSQPFQRRMKHLILKMDHQIKYFARNCAAMLLVILTLFATLLTVSPTVRATVVSWIREGYMGGAAYSFEGQSSQTHHQYILTQIPEGYRLDNILEDDDGAIYIYHTSDGRVLRFQYRYSTDDAIIYLNTQGYEYRYETVGNEAAELYIAPNKTDCSTIVWKDPVSETLLTIDFAGTPEELITLAESVKIK